MQYAASSSLQARFAWLGKPVGSLWEMELE
jgi:hypothetical protein